LKRVVIENGNVFAELMKTVRVCSLGQITKALFEVGGEYRSTIAPASHTALVSFAP
jgi:isobutyryl-CoA mutase